ncbi:MAG: hypothetical protein FGM37_09455, partial [Phycisphaerales bacterium]|nr:hypothetical protein [Phycisphaerales bacterium]
MEVWLDRRAASLRSVAVESDALLGYALLPWCDVTLWSVARSSDGPDWRCATSAARSPAHDGAPAGAYLALDLAHIDGALAYVERLPVERSLVAKAWRWRWSSAAWHCGFGGKPAALAPEWGGPLRR